jgi:DNA-binding transcriptional ArsR family regulator
MLDGEYAPMLSTTFGALADPNRLRIVELLLRGPRGVNELAVKLKLQQPQVSKHLKVLREAKLVEVTPQAQSRVYGLRAQPLKELHVWVERYRQLWDARFQELERVLDELEKLERKGAS